MIKSKSKTDSLYYLPEEDKLFDTKILLQPLIDALGSEMTYKNGQLEFITSHNFCISFGENVFPTELPFRMKEVFHNVNFDDACSTIIVPISGDLYLAGIYSEAKETVWIYLIDAKKFSLRLNNMSSTIPRHYISDMVSKYISFSEFQDKLADSVIQTFRKGFNEKTWHTSKGLI